MKNDPSSPIAARIGRTVFSCLIACAVFAGAGSAGFAAEWKFLSYYVPQQELSEAATYDVAFDQWYTVEGPATMEVSETGAITGDLQGQVEFGQHGQLFFYDISNLSVPDGFGVMDRSGDFFAAPWNEDFGFAIQIPEAAQQADFAGEWNFAALTASTVLTKTVFDLNSGSELFLEGPDSMILQDGSQYLVDVHRGENSSATLNLNLDTAGNAGEETLLWQGDGTLAFSRVEFPLLTNAARDFVVGMGQTGEGDEQTLVLGVRAPTNADASWLVGHWRFFSIELSNVRRDYFDPDSGTVRIVQDQAEQPQALPGERLVSANFGWDIDGELVTVSQEMANSLGITPGGVIDDDGDLIFLNASGDVLITAWNSGDPTIEIGIKISDEIEPVWTLNATVDGAGEIDAYPPVAQLSRSLSDEYLHGEKVVLRYEPHSGAEFLGWSGDIPAGMELADPLVLTMDRERSVTARFTPAPDGEDPPPGNDSVPPEEVAFIMDRDGDGMRDILEQLFAERDPGVPEYANPLRIAERPEGPGLGFVIREEFSGSWQVTYSTNLESGIWSELPAEAALQLLPVEGEEPLTEVSLNWPWTAEAERLFFRVEMDNPVQDDWLPKIPAGDPIEVELDDGQTVLTETFGRGQGFTVVDAPGQYELNVTVYEGGEAIDFTVGIEVNSDGYAMFTDQDGNETGSNAQWMITGETLFIMEWDQWGDLWAWTFTRLDSGLVLAQVRTPPDQEDAANFTVVGSFTKL